MFVEAVRDCNFERMLRAALPDFCRAHPQIELEVMSEWPCPEIGGLKRVLLMRKDDLRPEVHTVAAFLKGTVELGKAA